RRAMQRHLEVRRNRLENQQRSLSDPRRIIGERRLRVDRLIQRAERRLNERLGEGRASLRSLEARLSRAHPQTRLSEQRATLGRLEQRAIRAIQADVSREGRRIGELAGRLDALSPLKVLSRGYALAWSEEGRLVRNASELREGEDVRVRV